MDVAGTLRTFHEMTTALLMLKQHLNCFLPDGQTLLTRAAQAGDMDMACVLLDLGADIHLPARDGDNAALAAAKSGQWALHTELVWRGAKANCSDRSGYPSTYYLLRAFAESHGGNGMPLASLIRYLIRRGHCFDRPVRNPDDEDRKSAPTIPMYEVLHGAAEPLSLYAPPDLRAGSKRRR